MYFLVEYASFGVTYRSWKQIQPTFLEARKLEKQVAYSKMDIGVYLIYLPGSFNSFT